MIETRRGFTATLVVVVAFVVASVVAFAATTGPAGAGSSRSTSDPALAAAEELVRSIPSDQRYSCHIDDLTSRQSLGVYLYRERSHLRTSLTCGADGSWNSLEGYATFTSTAAADRVFDAYAPRHSDFCKDPTTWSSGGHEVGRVACYHTTAGGSSEGDFEYAVVVWTYAPLHLLGWAYDNGNDPDKLQHWWKDQAGPLSSPERVPELATSTSSNAAVKRLTARLPSATRSTCSAASLDDKPFDARDYSWRLWIGAALACRPRSTADSLSYVSVAADALEPFFENRYAGADDDATNGEACPARYQYAMDDQPIGSGLGMLSCSFDGSEALLGWSVSDDHVVAEATGADADALLRFAAAAGPQPEGTFQPANLLKPG